MMHSGPELLRLLKRHGFEVVSVRGSHYKLRHPDGREVILPYCQRRYPKATYFCILKDAGLRPADLRIRERVGMA
ncbi:type II toxin-antitoxin system HicA family toxin [Singulisphaera rosea]